MTQLRITAKYGANISDQWPTSTSKIWGTEKGNDGQGDAPYQSGISTMPLNGDEFYYVSQNGRYTMNLNYYVEDLNGEYVLDHTDSFKSNNTSWTTTQEDHYDIEGFSYTGDVEDGTRFLWNKDSRAYKVSFHYSRNSYSINFVNGDSASSQTFKYGADISNVDLKTAPKRPVGTSSDYTFAGWFDNELGAGRPVVLTGTMPAYNITLYAKWAAPTYKGTVHTNIEGTGKTIEIQIDYGGTINENSMPSVVDADGNLIQEGTGNATVIVPVNYSWVGWATKDGEDFTLYNFNTKLHSDITLYPYYINTQRFAVKYDKGEGSGTAPTDSREYAENSFADIKPALEITPPGGKTFLYWTANGAKYYPGDKVKITGNLTLKAEYGDTAGLAFLIYHSNYPNGEDLTTKPESKENNAAITLAEAGFKTPDGYYFAGWNTAANGSGTTYTPGTVVGIDNTSENHLYAEWGRLKEITLVAKSETVIYDGEPHAATGVEQNVFELNSGTYTVTGYNTSDPISTDVCEKTNSISGELQVSDRNGKDVTKQFRISTKDGKLTISKRPVTITSGSNSWPYDGNAHSEESATAATGEKEGFVGNDGATYSNFKTITNKGTVDNTFDYTLTEGTNGDNYEISQAYGQLEITAADEAHITITGNTDTQTYDGTEKTVSGYTTSELPAGITVSLKDNVKAEAKGTNGGEYPMGLTEGSFDVGGTENYTKVTVTVNDGKMKIGRRAVTFTSDSATKEYDGTPLTAPHVTIGGDGLAEGENAEFTFTGSQTEVGSSQNKFTVQISRSSVVDRRPAPVRRMMRLMAVLLSVDEDSAEQENEPTGAPEDNYDITYVYGTLTVTAKAEPKPEPENPGGGGGTTTNTTTTVYQPVVEPKVLGASRVIPVQEPVQEAEQPPVVEQKVLGATRTGSAVPMTGDDSSMGFYGWIALIAAAGMMGWLAADRKRRKNH